MRKKHLSAKYAKYTKINQTNFVFLVCFAGNSLTEKRWLCDIPISDFLNFAAAPFEFVFDDAAMAIFQILTGAH